MKLYLLLIYMGRLNDALFAAERGRARCLVDLMVEKYSIAGEHVSAKKEWNRVY